MIMRLVQVTVHAGKEAEFAQFFHDVAIPQMRNAPGLAVLLPGAPRPETPQVFSMVMIWDSLDALKSFFGDDYQNGDIRAEEAHLVRQRTISHFSPVELWQDKG